MREGGVNMVKTIACTFLLALGCTAFTCMAGSENKSASKHIIQVLKLTSEKSSLLKEFFDDVDLDKILDPTNTREETCDKRQEEYVWAITALSEEAISLILCHVLDVHIHARVYKKNTGNELIVVASQRGNHGQTWDFEFFDFDVRTNRLTPRTQESVGILQPKENEFLARNQKLRPSENGVTFLRLNEDGTIEAFPWTWMETRWENRTPAYRVVFKWNGSSFSKRITIQP